MARSGKGSDPGATKYQTTLQSFVRKVAAVPKKEAVENVEEAPAEDVKTQPRRKTKTKK